MASANAIRDEKDAPPHLVIQNHIIQWGFAVFYPLRNLALVAQLFLMPQLQEECSVEH